MRTHYHQGLKILLACTLVLILVSPVLAVNIPISFGVPRTGSISSPGAVDTYTFSAEKGDAVVVRIARTSGDIWPRITLYAPGGAELKREYSSPTAEIFFKLPAAGEYRVLVDDGFNGAYTGGYSLFVQRSNAPANMIPFEPGTAKVDSIDGPGMVDTFSFAAVQGDSVVVRVAKTSGDLWPRITLYGPDGAEVKREYSSPRSEIQQTLKSTGTYTILVDDGFNGAHAGDYSMFCQLASGGQSGGGPATGAVSVASTASRTPASTTTATAAPIVGTGNGPDGGWIGYLPFLLVALVIVGAVVAVRRRQQKRPGAPGPATPSGPRAIPRLDELRRSGVIDHDVIVSYASEDKPTADAVCAGLERRGIRCWIAPRDILAGTNYQDGIIDAINASRIMVLIYSSHANVSPYVIREATLAVSRRVIIIPFKIEDAPMSKTMEFIISVPHWLDAMTPPLEKHIEELSDTINALRDSERRRSAATE